MGVPMATKSMGLVTATALHLPFANHIGALGAISPVYRPTPTQA
jgi:hypothetical protein